ncbi:MAG: 50S ribosomal protein L31 [Patescibacteria group bacterium]
MKADIHPPYFADAIIACACGNKMKFGSTKQSIEVEICSQCHPYYTGKEKLIDTAGRVDKFKKRLTKVSDKPTRRGKSRK